MVQGVDGVAHVSQPPVPLDRGDREGRMPHPQPRMPAFVAVGGGPAPVLDQEQTEALLGGTEVLLRVEGAQRWVAGNSLVEAVDEPLEGRMSADGVVEGGYG